MGAMGVEKRFFGKQIEVKTGGEVVTPEAFKLDNQWHQVEDILTSWPDYSFPSDGRAKHRWWQRHHRNYYIVRTAEGDKYEIYYDRGVSLDDSKHRKWYVTRRF